MPETPEQARQFLTNVFGYGFIGLGGFFAFFNWIYFYLDQQCRRRSENHHVSMVGLLGLLLPLGCLIHPSLRIHALWVWALDPFSFVLIASGVESLREKRVR